MNVLKTPQVPYWALWEQKPFKPGKATGRSLQNPGLYSPAQVCSFHPSLCQPYISLSFNNHSRKYNNKALLISEVYLVSALRPVELYRGLICTFLGDLKVITWCVIHCHLVPDSNNMTQFFKFFREATWLNPCHSFFLGSSGLQFPDYLWKGCAFCMGNNCNLS